MRATLTSAGVGAVSRGEIQVSPQQRHAATGQNAGKAAGRHHPGCGSSVVPEQLHRVEVGAVPPAGHHQQLHTTQGKGNNTTLWGSVNNVRFTLLMFVNIQRFNSCGHTSGGDMCRHAVK